MKWNSKRTVLVFVRHLLVELLRTLDCASAVVNLEVSTSVNSNFLGFLTNPEELKRYRLGEEVKRY